MMICWMYPKGGFSSHLGLSYITSSGRGQNNTQAAPAHLRVRLDPDLGISTVDRNGKQGVAGPDNSDKGEDQDSEGLRLTEMFQDQYFSIF